MSIEQRVNESPLWGVLSRQLYERGLPDREVEKVRLALIEQCTSGGIGPAPGCRKPGRVKLDRVDLSAAFGWDRSVRGMVFWYGIRFFCSGQVSRAKLLQFSGIGGT